MKRLGDRILGALNSLGRFVPLNDLDFSRAAHCLNSRS